MGLSPSVCYLFTFQTLFTEITVVNRNNLCTNVFGCSSTFFVIFRKSIWFTILFVIFGNSKLFLSIFCDFWKFKVVPQQFLWFLEIQTCSSTLFLIFRKSIWFSIFFAIFGNLKLFNIFCVFLEIQNCSSTLFESFRKSIWSSILFVIFGNTRLFLNIISDFWKFKIVPQHYLWFLENQYGPQYYLWYLEILDCSSTLFLIFGNSKLLTGCFLIGWNFKILPLRCHMYDNS